MHQDYVRERELINTTRMFHEQLEGLTENLSERLRRELQDRFTKVKEDLDQQSASARRMVSESLLGFVEILALFVTLAGFLVGSGAIVLQAKGFGQNLIAIVLLLGGSLLFFLLIRGVVRLDRPSSRGLGLLLRGLVRVRGKSGGKE